MATVYLAKSHGTGGFERYVAIKLTHPHLENADGFEDETMADLLHEAKLAVRIRHPNIVPTVDVGENGRGLFLVMEYVEGDSLSGLVRRARKAAEELPLGMTMRVLCDALAGLHAAHELKDDDGQSLEVVHRDVSPQNILVGTDGMARLADFGIARAASRRRLTRPGSIKGKVAYMAPEQVHDDDLDRRCDVWAAAVIAWELIAKRRMFDKDDLAVAVQLVQDPIPDLRAAAPDVPPSLERAIHRALDKDRAARTPSAAAFRADLIAACKEAGIALFEHDQVGAVVERLSRKTLDERHRYAKELLASRRSLSEIEPMPGVASPDPTIPLAAPSSPSGAGVEPRWQAPPPGARPLDALAGARIASTSLSPTQRTDTSAVRDQLFPRRHKDRGLAIAIAAAAVVVSGLAVVVLSLSKRSHEAPNARAAHEVIKASSTPTAEPTVSVVDAETPVVDVAAASASAAAPASAPSTSVAASLSSAPKLYGTVPVVPGKSPYRGPAPVSTLATSPYGRKP